MIKNLWLELDPSDLIHQVKWESLAQPAQDTFGQPSDVWTNHGSFWALVLPLGGRELTNADQTKAISTHKIKMRNVGALAPSDRLTLTNTGQVFNIDQVNYISNLSGIGLDIRATELTSPQ